LLGCLFGSRSLVIALEFLDGREEFGLGG